jgi:hypothetical protein
MISIVEGKQIDCRENSVGKKPGDVVRIDNLKTVNNNRSGCFEEPSTDEFRLDPRGFGRF